MRNYIIVGLLCFVLLGLFGCSSSPEKKKEKLFTKGQELVAKYDFDAASKDFAELGKLDPNSPMEYYGSGLILEKKFQTYDALNVYLTIANTYPSFAPAHAGCWRIYTYLEKYEDALNAALAYNKALPSDPESKLLLAESFMNYNQPYRSLSFLDTALTLGSDLTLVNMMRAHVYALLHKLDSANVIYTRALDDKSSSPRVFIEAAGYLETIGLIDSAVSMSKKAVELSDYDNQTMLTHYFLVLHENYFYEAEKIIRRLEKKQVPEIVTLSLKTFLYDASKRYSPARHALSSISRIIGNTLSFWMLEMSVRAKVSDELTLAMNSDAIGMELSKGNYDQQFADFMIYSKALIVAHYLDDYTGLSELNKIVPLLARRPECELRKAYIYFRTGQQDEFTEKMETIKQNHSRQPVWLTGIADIYNNRFARRFDDARDFYTKALEADKWYRPAFEHFVAMYQRLGKYDEAVKLFSQYPHFAEQYPRLALLQAVCMVQNGDVEAGMELFIDRVAALKGDLTWFEKIREAVAKAHQPEKAVVLAAWLSGNDNKNPEALVLAAQIYSSNKQYKKALEAADDALSIDKESIDAQAEKGWALYKLGNTDEAVKILNEINKSHNYHVRTNYYLSQLLAAEGMEPNRAANLARKAVFDSQSALWTWVNLSRVYLQTGRYDLARGEAEKASHSYSGEPEPVFYLGMALYMEGKDNAKDELEKAIKLGLQGDELKEAKATLKKMQ